MLPANASPEIETFYQQDGCWGFDSTTKYSKNSGKYVSEEGREISTEFLKELVAVIQKSKLKNTLDLNDLGINQENVARHRDELMKQCIPVQYPSWKAANVSKDLCAFDVASISESARHRLVFEKEVSSNQVYFSATINDPEICSEKIEISSDNDCPWMLPWNVKVGSENWKTFSTELPLKLSFLPDRSANDCRSIVCNYLLNGQKYWQTEFWSDSFFWEYDIRKIYKDKMARNLIEQMPGFELIEPQFTVSAGLNPKDIWVELKPISNEKILSSKWHIRIKHGRQVGSWFQILNLHQKFEPAIQRLEWLEQWKHSGGERKVCIDIKNRESTWDIPDEQANEAWKEANLPSRPNIKLELYHDNKLCTRLFMSDNCASSIILFSEPCAGMHWLDSQEIDLQTESHSYLIIDADGRFRKKNLEHMRYD
ncbi:MAG: hypothetical protein KIT34_00240 [Cyanobacteria bacterium TGS_CYA1]|nr:hypothetical protein [Cyanobacteria bacterium TGS_CYA1]